jgi:hypothetical protein
VYCSNMILAILIIVSALLAIQVFGHFYSYYGIEELDLEYWECPECGTIVEATSIEGIVEGMRIHDIAKRCQEE